MEKAFCEKIQQYLDELYKPSDFNRLKDTIWTVVDHGYTINLIIAGKILVIDLVLFEEIPGEKETFLELLLELNAHKTRFARFCLIKGKVHFRQTLVGDFVELRSFKGHLTEFRETAHALKKELKAVYSSE